MPLGPGKYGARAEKILREVEGDLCVVIVLGPDGPGFDVCTSNPFVLRELPAILRDVADQIQSTIDTDIAALKRAGHIADVPRGDAKPQ